MGYDRFKIGVLIFLSNLDVGAYIFYENDPIVTFNKSFESTQNKEQNVTKVTNR